MKIINDFFEKVNKFFALKIGSDFINKYSG